MAHGHAPGPPRFSRRERQIMDAVYQQGEACVRDVMQRIAEAPSYSAVRALMNVLVDKGHLVRRRAGRKFTYRPTTAPSRARKSAMKGLVDTFFAGSVESAISALIDLRSRNLDDEELDRLAERIEAIRRRKERGT